MQQTTTRHNGAVNGTRTCRSSNTPVSISTDVTATLDATSFGFLTTGALRRNMTLGAALADLVHSGMDLIDWAQQEIEPG